VPSVIQLQLAARELTVLALGAHPDDVEIGCGGTLLRLAADRLLDAHVVVMTGSERRRAEAEHAARAFLGGRGDPTMHAFDLPDGRLPAHWASVKEALEGVATSVRPHVVLAPRPEDAHQDHRLLAELVPTVWRDAMVLHYEIPKWDGDLHPVTHYVPLDEVTAQRKVQLLHEVYESQVDRDWWDSETFMSLMRLRGVECRHRYAEGFVLSKAVLAV
jgi:LmbE family N-acetylglucosaminyl deacetylase